MNWHMNARDSAARSEPAIYRRLGETLHRMGELDLVAENPAIQQCLLTPLTPERF